MKQSKQHCPIDDSELSSGPELVMFNYHGSHDLFVKQRAVATRRDLSEHEVFLLTSPLTHVLPLQKKLN